MSAGQLTDEVIVVDINLIRYFFIDLMISLLSTVYYNKEVLNFLDYN